MQDMLQNFLLNLRSNQVSRGRKDREWLRKSILEKNAPFALQASQRMLFPSIQLFCFLFSGEKLIDLCLTTKTTAVNTISILSRTFEGYSHQPRMQNVLQK